MPDRCAISIDKLEGGSAWPFKRIPASRNYKHTTDNTARCQTDPDSQSGLGPGWPRHQLLGAHPHLHSDRWHSRQHEGGLSTHTPLVCALPLVPLVGGPLVVLTDWHSVRIIEHQLHAMFCRPLCDQACLSPYTYIQQILCCQPLLAPSANQGAQSWPTQQQKMSQKQHLPVTQWLSSYLPSHCNIPSPHMPNHK